MITLKTMITLIIMITMLMDNNGDNVDGLMVMWNNPPLVVRC